VQWYGLLAPAGTPAPIIAQLHSEVAKVLRSPEVRDRFNAEGAQPLGTSPSEFHDFIKSEIARWRPIVQAFGEGPN
jgi:tripartite-type tricarboxylate transporter receptor subunit TctC